MGLHNFENFRAMLMFKQALIIARVRYPVSFVTNHMVIVSEIIKTLTENFYIYRNSAVNQVLL